MMDEYEGLSLNNAALRTRKDAATDMMRRPRTPTTSRGLNEFSARRH
jgi:hypothetical protein